VARSAGYVVEKGNSIWVSRWLVLAVPSFLIAYAAQPVPGMLVVKQVLFEGVDKILLGILTAALYRP
jgi:predicted benzoate:H+ symporter BenE